MEKQDLSFTDEQILEFVKNRKMHQRVFQWADSKVLPGIQTMMKHRGNPSENDIRTFFLTALTDFFHILEAPEYQLRENSNLNGLLFTICERMWIRECKIRGRFSGGDMPDPPASSSSDHDLIHREKLAMVSAAVSRLEQPYRGVLVLHEYGELSHAEIALAAGYASPDVSKEIKSRAIKKLREIYKNIS
ncbi:MAG TPA: sigma-70 family RNA polymerase sigma factor [Saprospiraceae bacterium]|nr:sigma-70 family RNA polymerase sigma factor [Saprospiraceae bacterium]HRK80542.1 sigma-70 family RNA polymerase sigma factor [Saprospiraceae bacterium]